MTNMFLTQGIFRYLTTCSLKDHCFLISWFIILDKTLTAVCEDLHDIPEHVYVKHYQCI